MSSSFIFLPSLEAGCVDPATNKIMDSCTNTVRGFQPAALVTNVAVISGALSALFNPVVGAIIDFTPYRLQVGIWTAVFSSLVQGCQIYTVESTWFPMSFLQASHCRFYLLPSGLGSLSISS